MKISFSFCDAVDARRKSDLVNADPFEIYYRRYLANVEIMHGEQKLAIRRAPMVFLITSLQKALLASYVTGQPSVRAIWDTGGSYSLAIDKGQTVILRFSVRAEPC